MDFIIEKTCIQVSCFHDLVIANGETVVIDVLYSN